jgi:hypothetical protein
MQDRRRQGGTPRRKLICALVGVLLLIMVAGLVPGVGRASSSRPAFVYDQHLSWWVHQSLELASEYTGSQTKRIPLPTYVRCFQSDTAFNAGFYASGNTDSAAGVIAYYMPGTPYINLRALTCANAHQFTDGMRITETTAGAVSTLLHEALHRQGFNSEKLTECYADTSTKYAGWLAWWQTAHDTRPWEDGEHWGNWAEQLALQDTWHAVASSYRISKTTCRALTNHSSWADLVG